MVSVAVTAAAIAIMAMPRAAAAAVVVVHTAISAEFQDPVLYSEVSATHMLNHMKTWPAQDKCGFCHHRLNLYKQNPCRNKRKPEINSAKNIFSFDLFFCSQEIDIFQDLL